MNTLLSTIPELVADLAAGKMVILVDDADRENEGDLVIAADHITPEAINFMATHARGLICLTLTHEHCRRLALEPMTVRNGTAHGTAFTVSIEAASGVTTGISAADRARTVQAAVAPDAKPQDLVRPGHIFPLQAREGGVLARAGHTEAGCDLSAIAGLSPTAVICEIMNDDGTMSRLPELAAFASRHGLRMGAIADLIEYRTGTESLVERLSERTIRTAHGEFRGTRFRDGFGGEHLALSCGRWASGDQVLTAIHERVSILDLLDVDTSSHSWSLPAILAKLQTARRGVALLLNCGEAAAPLACDSATRGSRTACSPKLMDLRLHGVSAQILRSLDVVKTIPMAAPRHLPSTLSYGSATVSPIAQGG
ncbi:3,4-dihydroxy-2-butanone 4-phosphate synthase [Cupriavidus necator]|uniref:3,4-dihydroxy-2-butanone 4-phosphate synthase n=1 Tax=Cupriavidus necator TaxID=106590 RepID=A0A1K0J041_CUPNE|nr:3,4-dihydroxy-2-butanone 4-phosphate synthase [Cupriavidus necator]